MNLAAWRVFYPELSSLDDTMAQAFLDAAEVEIDSDLFGDQFDNAHGLLTAHKVCLSPFGKNARLQSKDGKTTYGMQYDELKIGAACGVGRVV